jgi:hypothetical protein
MDSTTRGISQPKKFVGNKFCGRQFFGAAGSLLENMVLCEENGTENFEKKNFAPKNMVDSCKKKNPPGTPSDQICPPNFIQKITWQSFGLNSKLAVDKVLQLLASSKKIHLSEKRMIMQCNAFDPQGRQ